MSKMREAFEKWCRSSGKGVSLCECGCGAYRFDATRDAWAGYQAAFGLLQPSDNACHATETLLLMKSSDMNSAVALTDFSTNNRRTNMTHDEMIQVIQAHKEGKQIEFSDRGTSIWETTPNPSWNFNHKDYRVKVEPITRYVYIGIHPDSPTIFHSSVCYSEHEDKDIYFQGKYNERYTINGALKLSIDPHTQKILSVEIVK